jgi:hypothetical protein
MTACSTAETTAVNVSTDMTEGIIARFRTMAITRTSVLTGQVLGGLIRTTLGGVMVVAVAFALGFKPRATMIDWFAATAMFALLTIALTWLTIAFGLLAKTPPGANSHSLLVVVLPFVSSAFVPTATMGSPATNPSRPSSKACAAFSPGPPSATTLHSPSHGAPASVSSATSGLASSTTAAAPNDSPDRATCFSRGALRQWLNGYRSLASQGICAPGREPSRWET